MVSRDARDDRIKGTAMKENLEIFPPRSALGSGRWRLTNGGGGGAGGGGSPAGGSSSPSRSSTMTMATKPAKPLDQAASPGLDTLSPLHSPKLLTLSPPICGYMGHVPGKDARNMHGKTWSALVRENGSSYIAQASKAGTESAAATGSSAVNGKEGRSVIPPCAGYSGYTPGIRSRFGQPWRETVVSLVENARTGRQWRNPGGTIVRVKLGGNSVINSNVWAEDTVHQFRRRTMRAL